MGKFFSKLFEPLYHEKRLRILILGLDNAGKTTILYKLKINETVNTIPTIGFNVEILKRDGVYFMMWDLGGQDKLRSLWRHYYQNTDALIFVVDSNDKERFKTAKNELHSVMNYDLMKDVNVLIFCNRQDLPDACTTEQLANALEINKLKTKVCIKKCVATKGIGLTEGFDWIAKELCK